MCIFYRYLASFNGQLHKTLKGHTNLASHLTVLPNDYLASIAGYTVNIWYTKFGTHVMTLSGHGNSITCLTVLKNGNLASGSYDKTIKIWNITNGQNIQTLIDNSLVTIITSLHNGDLIRGEQNWNIKIWNINDWKIKKMFKICNNYASFLLFYVL